MHARSGVGGRFLSSAMCAAVLTVALPACRLVGGEWADPARQFRVHATVPAGDRPVERMVASMPMDLGKDLPQLGVRGTVDPGSFRLLTSGPGRREVAVGVRDGRIEWETGALAADRDAAFDLYFNLGGGASPQTPAPGAAAAAPDFFAEHTGRPCDFNDGAFGGITGWSRADHLKKRVENGVLILDVKDDAYLIWGTMWGPERPGTRPVRIDIDRYWTLEIRLRQSLARAKWEIFGRPAGKERLLTHEFTVHGTNWQTARIDLRRDLHWSGVLSALRIDPADSAEAHVEIDWIRLAPAGTAARDPVETPGSPTSKAATVDVSPTRSEVPVDTEQIASAVVRDAAGKPVAGQPVRIWIDEPQDGVLRLNRSAGTLKDAPGCASLALGPGARRGLTDVFGRVSVRYRAGRRASDGERLRAEAEFAGLAPAATSVTLLPGPADHYEVEPVQPCVVRPGEPSPEVSARRADRFGNRLPGDGSALSWTAPDAAVTPLAPLRSAPDAARAVLSCDPARRWVTFANVADAAGLTGRSAAVSFLPSGPKADPVRLLSNGYFAVRGKAWLPLGGFYANWVGVPSPDGEWDKRLSFTDATEAQIVDWLKLLQSNGVTAQRFMLRTHRKNGMEPMDIGGRVNPGLFAAFLRYMDLARPFGIRFLVVLHEDYAKPCYHDRNALERFCLPWYEGEDLAALPPFQRRFIRDRRLIGDSAQKYTDPDVLACQDRYACEIVGRLKDNPSVFAYELENEMVDCPAAWAEHALATIRSVDPVTPVCVSHGGGGLATADPAWWKEKTSIDFYTYHLYPHGSTSPEMDYGTAVDVLARYGRIGKPAFLGESAGDQFSYGPDRETRRWTMRDIVWFSLLNGNPGCFFWNARASEFAEFRLAGEILGRVDWATFERARPAASMTVPHALDDDRWFRSDAGREAYARMGLAAKRALDRGAGFDFVLGDGATEPPESGPADFGVSPGYQLKALVRKGGGEAVLYARNFAGTWLWECEKPNRWKQYLRSRKAAALRVAVNLPGKFNVDIWDLDDGRHTTRRAKSGETLDLGASDHDIAIHLRRR